MTMMKGVEVQTDVDEEAEVEAEIENVPGEEAEAHVNVVGEVAVEKGEKGGEAGRDLQQMKKWLQKVEMKKDPEEVEVETERERGGVADQETDLAEVDHVTVTERGEEAEVETEAGGVHVNVKLQKPVVWVMERRQKWTMARLKWKKSKRLILMWASMKATQKCFQMRNLQMNILKKWKIIMTMNNKMATINNIQPEIVSDNHHLNLYVNLSQFT